VERAFGVLKARFAILKNPVYLMKEGEITQVMKACIILHNMIIEDDRVDEDLLHEEEQTETVAEDRVDMFIERYFAVHHRLQADLMKHLWLEKGTLLTCFFNKYNHFLLYASKQIATYLRCFLHYLPAQWNFHLPALLPHHQRSLQ